MSNVVHIDIAKDFSPTPGGRYRADGRWSGEEFRETFLVPALRAGNSVEVDLDGPLGFTTSFLEEAFGGLVRIFGPDVVGRVKFVAEARPGRVEKAKAFVQRAIKEYTS